MRIKNYTKIEGTKSKYILLKDYLGWDFKLLKYLHIPANEILDGYYKMITNSETAKIRYIFENYDVTLPQETVENPELKNIWFKKYKKIK